MSSDFFQPSSSFGGKSFAIGAVVLMHAVALWAVQQAAQRPPQKQSAQESPAALLVQLVAMSPAPEPVAPPPAPQPPTPPPPAPTPPPPAPPPPAPAPPPPVPKPPPKPKLQQAKPKPAVKPVAKPAPVRERTPLVAPEPAPAPTPSVPAQTPSVAVPSAAPAAPAAAPAPAVSAAAAAPVLERSQSSNIAALRHAGIQYPPQSARLRESGVVRVRVLIGANGRAKEATIAQSSGSPRLDNAALQGILRNGRFEPSKRNGQPVDDWYILPVEFTPPR